MAIEILPYNPRWPDEFRRIGAILRQVLGDQALRINHIGSTSVPGLAAKDIIDVQICYSRRLRLPCSTMGLPAACILIMTISHLP